MSTLLATSRKLVFDYAYFTSPESAHSRLISNVVWTMSLQDAYSRNPSLKGRIELTVTEICASVRWPEKGNATLDELGAHTVMLKCVEFTTLCC